NDTGGVFPFFLILMALPVNRYAFVGFTQNRALNFYILIAKSSLFPLEKRTFLLYNEKGFVALRMFYNYNV
ncbi:MAG: hypothetical protein IKW66_01520, partial [Clostridia bacterium]|nr:hypothetical protein [Clostridia bacterium]